MGAVMQRFIAEANIKRYKRMLCEAPDPAKKATLLQLLADEEKHLCDLRPDPDWHF